MELRTQDFPEGTGTSSSEEEQKLHRPTAQITALIAAPHRQENHKLFKNQYNSAEALVCKYLWCYTGIMIYIMQYPLKNPGAEITFHFVNWVFLGFSKPCVRSSYWWSEPFPLRSDCSHQSCLGSCSDASSVWVDHPGNGTASASYLPPGHKTELIYRAHSSLQIAND